MFLTVTGDEWEMALATCWAEVDQGCHSIFADLVMLWKSIYSFSYNLFAGKQLSDCEQI